ncbi:phage holin [Oceanobacillus damuensis]|uniref:phage holin n=1 Tax=Oceanobacillus damuensis TaxID=937928 RepID=UPI0008369A07|nr:phage holin [Oceanobacillus damuensis]
MKINWKVRIHSYPFWVALFGLIGLIVTDAGWMNMGSYETYAQAIMLLLVTGGVITDHTTNGLSDSKQALGYTKPKKDVK